MNKLDTRHKNLGISVASYCVNALLFRRVVDVRVISFFYFNVAAHESGHYVEAKSHNAECSLPVLYGVGSLTFGLTEVSNAECLNNKATLQTISAGWKGGVMAILAMTPLVLIGSISLPLIVTGLMYELISATIGSDGVKKRQYRRRNAKTFSFRRWRWKRRIARITGAGRRASI